MVRHVQSGFPEDGGAEDHPQRNARRSSAHDQKNRFPVRKEKFFAELRQSVGTEQNDIVGIRFHQRFRAEYGRMNFLLHNSLLAYFDSRNPRMKADISSFSVHDL